MDALSLVFGEIEMMKVQKQSIKNFPLVLSLYMIVHYSRNLNLITRREKKSCMKLTGGRQLCLIGQVYVLVEEKDINTKLCV